MPTATLTAGDQTATIQYGYGAINRMSIMAMKALPNSAVASRIRQLRDSGGDQDPAKFGQELLAELQPEDLVQLMVGQSSHQVEIVRDVLVSVSNGTAQPLYPREDMTIEDFVDRILDPELGHAITQHMAEAQKAFQEKMNPKARTEKVSSPVP